MHMQSLRAMSAFAACLGAAMSLSGQAPETDALAAKRYYAHEAVYDRDGILAPWYTAMNGQVDWRVRIAAETLKRYPWTDTPSPAPHYVFNGTWRISEQGEISIPPLSDWDNGDFGQRAAYILTALVDYYRYSGDAAAIGHIWITVEALRKHCLTGLDHPWPRFLISVPTKGKPYGQADRRGMIQLDIVAEVGIGVVRAYQLVGNKDWWALAKHWADLFARHRRKESHLSPWPRYANAEDVPWEDLQTGGVVFILEFLDEVTRLGYTGRNGEIVAARDAGVRYLRDVLLPRWTENDTWGRNYWDWNDPVQAENVTEFVARYLMAHPKEFPDWRNDVRNILTLFLNRTSVDPGSGGGVFGGAWAYPESCGCCGRSLWYGPMELAPVYAELGVRTGDPWALEMARRQMILATYDAHETGVVEDNIDGGQIVAGGWFKIAHPMALKHALNAIAWQPEIFAPARENHIVRMSHVARRVVYSAGSVEYETFPAPGVTQDVLRLSFEPVDVTVDGQPARRARVGSGPRYWADALADGDWLVTIRRDGTTRVHIRGADPQRQGEFAADNTSLRFRGNQVRILGRVSPDGGQAQVVLDGVPYPVLVDTWSPVAMDKQVLFYRNGLVHGEHTLDIRPLGKGNPISRGTTIRLQAVQFSDVEAPPPPSEIRGWKPAPQRVIFGYTGRKDYVSRTGERWRPATEWVVRAGHMADSVRAAWWATPRRATVHGTTDPEIYRYGGHAPELTAFFTAAPGTYSVRVHLMETRRVPASQRLLDIEINGKPAASRVDIAATAGGYDTAAVLTFRDIQPWHGVIAVRLKGHSGAEALVQAMEILPGTVPGGKPIVAVPAEHKVGQNLLVNGGFEETVSGSVGCMGDRVHASGWTYVFASARRCYIWAETDYIQHPHLGLPEIHGGKQALRTHTDGDGLTLVYQEVDVDPGAPYEASVWIRAADLHGKGFGKHPGDSAGLIVQELAATGNVLLEHPRAAVVESCDYRKLAVRFRTSPSTVRVRFVLETVQKAHYEESHVTYDDCSLVKLDEPGPHS